MKLLELFLIFFKIGAFTIGGGYAMIPLIEEEIVDKRNLMKREEFLDAIAIAQASPGPIAVNVAIFIGRKVRKTLGSIICTLGVALPSFLIILVVSMFFAEVRDNEKVEGVFKGIKPAVAGLMAASVYRMFKSANLDGIYLIVPPLAFSILLLGVSPIFIIIGFAVFAIILNKFKKGGEER